MKQSLRRPDGFNECYCSVCEEWYDTTNVEFLNVEENVYGEDSFTFECHVCNEVQTSLVRFVF